MTALKEWLAKNEISMYRMAKLCHVTAPTIINICNCKRNPSLELALRIQAVSQNQIELTDLINFPMGPRGRPKED